MIRSTRKYPVYPICFALVTVLLTVSCAPVLSPGAASRSDRSLHALLSAEATSYLGIPYRYGGSDRSGMDCSGLIVRLCSNVYGLQLPHRTSELFRMGAAVSYRSLQSGDLIFFRDGPGLQPSHVGLYLGGGRFIHASVSRGVIISKLREPYYRRRYAGARRMGRLQ